MRKFQYLIAITYALTWASSCFSQNDFGIWSGLEVNYSLTKDIKFGLETQARFDNNVSRMKESYLSPSVKWDPIKMLKVAFNYRLSSIPFNSNTTNRNYTHRYTLDLELRNFLNKKGGKSDFDLTFRVRGTREYERNKRTESYIRFRLKADYNIPKTKITPFVATELFCHFNDQITYTFEEVSTTNNFNKMRFTLGADFPLDKAKNHIINAFGMCQSQILDSKNDFILGLGYAYNFEHKTKKKKQ